MWLSRDLRGGREADVPGGFYYLWSSAGERARRNPTRINAPWCRPGVPLRQLPVEEKVFQVQDLAVWVLWVSGKQARG